eukprot:2221020-Pleurochrysis_carterae.AAC.1
MAARNGSSESVALSRIRNWGPVNGNNNENIPNFTRAECNEARVNTVNTGGGERIPALQNMSGQ